MPQPATPQVSAETAQMLSARLWDACRNLDRAELIELARLVIDQAAERTDGPEVREIDRLLNVMGGAR